MELGSAMPQLYRVFSLVATVGATSSGVERSFCLKRLKSYTRNTMGQGCLSSQLCWPLRGHWSSHWKRQLVGMTGSQSIPLKRNREQNLHISKLTNIWCRPKMSFPSLKEQQPPLAHTQAQTHVCGHRACSHVRERTASREHWVNTSHHLFDAC